jgi:hypothetical protein
VAFLDDDDWWGEGRLQQLLLAAHAGNHPSVLVASYFHFMLPDGSHRIVPEVAPDPEADHRLGAYLVRRAGLKFGETAMQTSTLLVSSDLAKKTRWNTELRKHQDWDFILRLLQQPDVKFIWAQDATCFVQKDSPGSISKRMDWKASLDWIRTHSDSSWDVRARSDFLWVHVLRAALAQRSINGFCQFIFARPTRPHFAAIVVGLSGLVQFAGLKR